MKVYFKYNGNLRIVAVDTNNHLFAISEVRKHMKVPELVPVFASIPGEKK